LVREDSSDESGDEEVKEHALPKKVIASDTFFFSSNDSRFDGKDLRYLNMTPLNPFNCRGQGILQECQISCKGRVWRKEAYSMVNHEIQEENR
jgi:hypothetical protein